MGKDWSSHLRDLIRGADHSLVISSPYISGAGASLVVGNLSDRMKSSGSLLLLTDLSPMSICQGSTDPSAIRTLAECVHTSCLHHLPKLHAKIYISGNCSAIVTSGNLTRGGLALNYEYGVRTDDSEVVGRIRRDVMEYAGLGAVVGLHELIEYCQVADRVREAHREHLSKISRVARREFDELVRSANDRLVRLRLAGGPLHAVFEQAILYYLRRHGPLTTSELHELIEPTFPDLCDNTVDRVIEGVHFGKRWKHAVRTAQQHLKKKGDISLYEKHWKIAHE